jgi:hypothetical protein
MAGTQTNSRALAGLVVLSMLLLVFAARCPLLPSSVCSAARKSHSGLRPRVTSMLTTVYSS